MSLFSKKPTRHFSKQQEKAVAKSLGGRTTANSGATSFDKGDVVTEDILVECKTKVKTSEQITIKKEWIRKNREEAFAMGKQYSTIAFNFGPDEENYYIIDEYMFKMLQELLEKY